MVSNVDRREGTEISRQQLHGETESRESFILKVKKENFIKTEDNSMENKKQKIPRRGDNFWIKFPKGEGVAEKYEGEDRRVVLSGIVMDASLLKYSEQSGKC